MLTTYQLVGRPLEGREGPDHAIRPREAAEVSPSMMQTVVQAVRPPIGLLVTNLKMALPELEGQADNTSRIANHNNSIEKRDRMNKTDIQHTKKTSNTAVTCTLHAAKTSRYRDTMLLTLQ